MSANALLPSRPRPQIVLASGSAPPAVHSPTLRVLAVDADPAAREFYRAALPRLGHEVQLGATGPDLAAACRLLKPDLVLTGPHGLAGVEAACRERPVPVVLVSASYEPLTVARALASDCVVACLTWPVEEAALGAALALAARRFEQVRALRAEVADLAQALEDRKVIERAKGALTRRAGVDEDGAYRRMRRVASNTNQKMIDVGRQLLAAEAVFAGLEAARD